MHIFILPRQIILIQYLRNRRMYFLVSKSVYAQLLLLYNNVFVTFTRTSNVTHNYTNKAAFQNSCDMISQV